MPSKSASAKKAHIVVLRLSPKGLARFPSDVPTTRSASLSPTKPDLSPSVQPPEPADHSSESNATPARASGNDDVDNSLRAPPDADGKKKKGGAVAGRKRAPPSIDPNAPPRERGRPGPKKKPRL